MAGNKRNSRASGRGRVHLTRDQLLPTPASDARGVSLKHHLALVALRQGEGNSDLVANLLRTVYLTYLLLEDRADAHALDTIADSEIALKQCIEEFAMRDSWWIPDSSCGAIAAVLRMHDHQLASLPVHRIDSAGRRLAQILATGEFPEIKQPAGYTMERRA